MDQYERTTNSGKQDVDHKFENNFLGRSSKMRNPTKKHKQGVQQVIHGGLCKHLSTALRQTPITFFALLTALMLLGHAKTNT